MRVRQTRANGQLAVGHDVYDDEAGSYVREVMTAASLRGGAIAELVFFRRAGAFAGFELPERLDA